MTDSHDDDLRRLQDFLRSNGLALESEAWRTVLCRFASKVMTHPEAEDRVAGLAGSSGWISRTDRNTVVRNGAWQSEPGSGRILAAELAMPDGRSVSLRHLDGDRWLCVEAAEGEGTERFLARDVEYLPVSDEAGMLRYTVYWRLDGDRYRPVASRFTGFGPRKE